MGSGRLCNLARMHMHSDILDEVSNEDILKAFVKKKPRILEFGGSIIKAFNYFLLINLNGMLFLIRFLMLQNSCVLVFITYCQNFFFLLFYPMD